MRTLCSLVLWAVVVGAQSLPPGARIIERATVPNARTGRELVLWMERAEYFLPPRDAWAADDFLYGGRWNGIGHVSLIDVATRRVINTVALPKIPIPQSAMRYGYHPLTSKEFGPVRVLYLQDLTGEGVKGQFYLLQYLNSSHNHTFAFGYSPTLDRAVQYSIVDEGKRRESIPVIFQKPQVRPGHWMFRHYGDHGDDAIYDEDVRFDAAAQQFVRRVKITKQQMPGSLPKPAPGPK